MHRMRLSFLEKIVSDHILKLYFLKYMLKRIELNSAIALRCLLTLSSFILMIFIKGRFFHIIILHFYPIELVELRTEGVRKIDFVHTSQLISCLT